MNIPTDPATRLTRKEAAAALTAAGYRTAPQTLAALAMAKRGESGPRFRFFGKTVSYAWGDLLAWAESRAVYRGGNQQDAA